MLKGLFGKKTVNALFSFMYPGNVIHSDVSEYIKEGYEKNPYVFSIVNKIIQKSASCPIIPMMGDKELDVNPIEQYFEANDTDFTFIEFRKFFHLFRLIAGESLVYAPKLTAGNNTGLPISIEILPPHLTDIETSGKNKIIKYYRLQNNEQTEVDPKDIYHTRLFLSTKFDTGDNLRALSPLKVAFDIVAAQNAADKQVKSMFEAGMPPFALINENLDSNEVVEQKTMLEKAWREKQKDIPLLAGGKITKIDFGFSNIRDMQIMENDKRVLKVLCALYGVHESLFTAERATMDNMGTARKLMYEDRIIPDVLEECAMYNKIYKEKGITFEIDYSQIPALQEDREKMARIYSIGYEKNAVTGDELREAIGLDPLNIPETGIENITERILFGQQQTEIQPQK